MGDEGFRNINIFKNLLELYVIAQLYGKAYREARKIEVFLYLIRYFILKTKDSKQSVKNLDFGNIFKIKYRNHVKKK